MKSAIGKRVAALAVIGVLEVSAAGTLTAPAVTEAAAAVKSGLVKENGKYYYYAKGKKVKNTWKKVGSYKYYFGSGGAACTGVKKIKGAYYVFDKNGRMQKSGWATSGSYRYYLLSTGKAVTGVRLINGKFCSFASNGRYSKAKTKKIRAAAVYEKDFSALKALIGEPKSADYVAGCYGSGEDGILNYGTFTVYTYREGTKEIYMGVG